CYRDWSSDVCSSDLKMEMLAGVSYGRAVIAHLEGKLEEALTWLEQSEKLRKALGDPSRAVRVYAVKGKILEARGDIPSAKDLYRSEERRVGEEGRYE